MGKMIDFISRNGCKDGHVRTGGISTIYLQCGRVHLCNFLLRFYGSFRSLRRLCVVFADVFADLCFDMVFEPHKTFKNIHQTIGYFNTFLNVLSTQQYKEHQRTHLGITTTTPKDALAEANANEQMGLPTEGPLPQQADALMKALGGE